MNPRYVYALLALLTVLVMYLFFMLNPSYEKSVSARYYYEVGEYKLAHKLAVEAIALDTYNKMAITIESQSVRALRYVEYIEQAKRYLAEINSIAAQQSVSAADAARVRSMCVIVIEGYDKLGSSILVEQQLLDDALMYQTKFKKLYEKINKSV